ncbi:hypothetical protein ASD11_16520 [Aeromicrobium sp. Root495]|uniref:hypothetical protein n=1 Tax=Aeromicrobium sp. Root495 TaxID=1736550 RepID=UPI000701C0F2|nr:hypothetical protein [Aeromicrobium sp. Root495]KQY56072.1 hypothetical protein ASD11_16520 [Aeromicrobium sp. Root495]
MPRTIRTVLAVIAASALGAVVLAPVAAQAATPYKATIKTSATRTNVGSVVTVSGTVTGGPVAGRKVTIYSYNASKDNAPSEKEKVVGLTSTGKYSAKIRLRDGGFRIFRVVKGAEGGHAAVKTSSAAIRVFRTVAGFELSDRKIDGTSVDGVSSRGGWEVYNASPVTFDLSPHGCISFSARAGVDTGAADSSVTGVFRDPDSFIGFYSGFTVFQTRGTTAYSSAVVSGHDFQVSADTGEASKLALTEISFKCNAPYDL